MTRGYQHNFEIHLTLQRLAPKTKEAYLGAITALSSYHQQAPDDLTNDQIQDYLLYCIQEKKLAWSSCNVLFCGLKKYYQEFLGRTETEFTIPPRPRSKQLPMLLSKEEVAEILKAPVNLKHRALLTMVYGSGLRVSEVTRLKPVHIESNSLKIRVEQSKGHKDRYTILSRKGLDLLREYWRAYQPKSWLFFGREKEQPMSINTAQRIYYNAKKKAGITKGRGIHTLRHCFATHSLDLGTDVFVIKRWMGHSSIKTTWKYIHLTPDYLSKIKSPLDLLEEGGES